MHFWRYNSGTDLLDTLNGVVTMSYGYGGDCRNTNNILAKVKVALAEKFQYFLSGNQN